MSITRDAVTRPKHSFYFPINSLCKLSNKKIFSSTLFIEIYVNDITKTSSEHGPWPFLSSFWITSLLGV